MKLRFEIDQAESFRRGIDRPKSIVSIEVNPADLPDETRSLIAKHLVGIDVVQHYYHYGEILKGYSIKEMAYVASEPKRIVAKAVNLDALIEAIRANDLYIENIERAFDRPVQLQLIETPPKNESEFITVSDQHPNQMGEISAAIRQKRRICFDCFLHDVQTGLNHELNANSYVVKLLPLPALAAQGRFYCEPVFVANFLGRPVYAHSPTIVLNEKSGRIVETNNLFQALEVYLLAIRPGIPADDLSILMWESNRWVIVPPESLMRMVNDASSRVRPVEHEIPALK